MTTTTIDPSTVERTYVKTTLDGRQVEVINGWLCLDGKPETDALVVLDEHPNRQAILKASPKATHMGGRLPLTMAVTTPCASACARWSGRRCLPKARSEVCP
jgi:hypothetical protein